MRESASAGVAPALKVQVQGECRLVAALKVQVQTSGHALSLSGECALALCVLWFSLRYELMPCVQFGRRSYSIVHI